MRNHFLCEHAHHNTSSRIIVKPVLSAHCELKYQGPKSWQALSTTCPLPGFLQQHAALSTKWPSVHLQVRRILTKSLT